MTKVVNIFGGPGVGKSTVAMELTSLMKRNGTRVEYVNEYVKGHMFSGRTDALELQEYIFAKQHHKQHILRDKVDYIITDAPLLLSCIYAPNDALKSALETYIWGMFNRFDNVNIVLKRDLTTPYQQYGREQTEVEAIIKDAEIQEYLEWHTVEFMRIPSDVDAAQVIFNSLELS